MLSQSLSWLLGLLGGLILWSIYGAVYRIWFHPLAKFPGPWYAAATSLTQSLICLFGNEPEWLLGLAKKHVKSGLPIRITPNMLLFPKASSLKDIYTDSKYNTKAEFYTSGALGPPTLFTTADGEEHKALRKALGGSQWSIGSLKKNWEPRIDTLLSLLTTKLAATAEQGEPVPLSDRLPEFAADVLTLVAFSEAWGFVRNGRDEGQLLQSWREGLAFFGFGARSVWFRRNVLASPTLAPWFLPRTSDARGTGFLMKQADRVVTERERRIDEEGFAQDKPDFLQYCLEARVKGAPLTPAQKRGQSMLLFQAGADTTGTGLGSILRFVATHPAALARARAEIDAADRAGLLGGGGGGSPVQFDEARAHLPYTSACIREGHRLHPPVTNCFPRVVPPLASSAAAAAAAAAGPGGGGAGRVVGGVPVPGGVDIMTVAYVVHRDPEMYGPDPEAFRPERWLFEEGDEEGRERVARMEAANFAFGMGPRICLGKELALMETYKVVAEILRRFDIEVVNPGKYIITGGISYNEDFLVKLKERTPAMAE